MQILLTESEYKALNERALIGDQAPKGEDLQEFCTMVANRLPLKTHDNEPWGCILTEEEEWYCDECPAQNFCPHPNKNWSK